MAIVMVIMVGSAQAADPPKNIQATTKTSLTDWRPWEPEIANENFQRVKKLIDCQAYAVEKMHPAHPDFQRVVCFYDVYYIQDEKEVHLVLAISKGQFQFINPQ
jgi:hypothetical protein